MQKEHKNAKECHSAGKSMSLAGKLLEKNAKAKAKRYFAVVESLLVVLRAIVIHRS